MLLPSPLAERAIALYQSADLYSVRETARLIETNDANVRDTLIYHRIPLRRPGGQPPQQYARRQIKCPLLLARVEHGERVRAAMARMLRDLRMGEPLPITGKRLGELMQLSRNRAVYHLYRMLREHGVVVEMRVRKGRPAGRELIVVHLPEGLRNAA